VTELLLKAPPGGGRYDVDALADLLGVDDVSRIVLQRAQGQVLVRIYPTNPLADLVPATPEDLVMQRGRIVVGRHYDGARAWLRLFDPRTGNAQRIVMFGTTGAGKSRALQLLLAACKRNGIVVHLADLKEGQSVPEAAAGNVATRVTTLEEAILLLRALVAEAKDRMRRYGEMGRSGFILGMPDPLVYGVIDEANRLLDKTSPYREEAAGLIKELGRTGRSVGVGVVIAAQASHLEELGGNDTLRAMLKEGEVVLLRWSSSMMQALVSDGILPRGATLQPIPKVTGIVQRIRRYDETADQDDEEEPNTQGMAYHLTSTRPDAMLRFSMVGSLEPCDGHDPLILKLYGDGPAPGQPLDLEAYRDPIPEEDGAPGGNAGVSAGPAASAGPPMRLPDRILRALRGGPLATYDVHAAVIRDGGKAVNLGSVRNALVDLRAASRVASDNGTHTLT
jgi:hypothetical protein